MSQPSESWQAVVDENSSKEDVEHGNAPPSLTEDEETPSTSRRFFSSVRYSFLNTYRRLFSFIFLVNAAVFIFVMVTSPTPTAFINAAAANMLVGGLIRQPLVLNSLFLIFCTIPRSAPLWLRRLLCKVFHLGGVHSGCGVASCVWYIGFLAIYTLQYQPSAKSTSVLVLAYSILALLLAIIIGAYPRIRSKRHDHFELTHRFSGWACILLFWALILITASEEPSMSSFLLTLPAFWFLIVTTVATIHPWVLLQHVPVTPEVLSSHAIRLHFNHTSISFGQGLSLAHHPLGDWHSFATFTDRFDTPASKFSVLVSKAGDWTSGVIKNPPTRLWKRGVPVYGFAYVMRVYSRIIVVTTGSGIGPCLSFIDDDNKPAMRVVWQTRSPLDTYGTRTIDLVKKMDPNPVVLDTTKTGRTDMLPLIMKLYREFEAEAVCVVSNPVTTKKLVFELESRAVPAYGPIFDS